MTRHPGAGHTTRRRRVALAYDPDALPLLFGIDPDGHEYDRDLLDLAQENTTP